MLISSLSRGDETQHDNGVPFGDYRWRLLLLHQYAEGSDIPTSGRASDCG